MDRSHRWRVGLAALVAAWSLFGCGGDGGARTKAPVTANPAQNEAGAPAMVNNVAVDGRNWINYRRGQAGVAVLAHNAVIDQAALAHSEYQRINNQVTHEETPGKPGFIGAHLIERLAAVGYDVGRFYAVGEVISASSNKSGVYMAEELITAIYHRFVMFEPRFKEIGTGAASTSAGYNYLTSDFAAREGYGPGLGAGNVVTWPFNGQAGVAPNFFSDNEQPDAVADRNEVGYPISVHADLDLALAVQTFTIRPRGGADLPVKLLKQGLDPNTTAASVAAIVPLTPLKAGTTYDVTFTGAAGGSAVSRNWSFTTR